MRLTPESKSVLDMLLTGGTVTSASISIGPLDVTTRLLLQVLIDNYDQLFADHGADQAESLLKVYLEALKPENDKISSDLVPQAEEHATVESTQQTIGPETARSPPTIPPLGSMPCWRLHDLSCRSIKGVAPPGEEFSFSFEGKSTLLFGPNGSGKSSLLGAVAWVLTRLTLTDEPVPTEKASIHKTSQDPSRGSKICDWPTISTLPEMNDPSSVTPVSMAMIHLKSCDGTADIYFRRTLS